MWYVGGMWREIVINGGLTATVVPVWSKDSWSREEELAHWEDWQWCLKRSMTGIEILKLFARTRCREDHESV